jgi:hypothetical protein
MGGYGFMVIATTRNGITAPKNSQEAFLLCSTGTTNNHPTMLSVSGYISDDG